MNRARYLQKFALIFLVFMLPLGQLTFDKLNTLYLELQNARLELLGVETINQALPAYKAALDLASLHMVVLARNKPDTLAAIEAQRGVLENTAIAFNNTIIDGPFAFSRLINKDPADIQVYCSRNKFLPDFAILQMSFLPRRVPGERSGYYA